MSPAGQATDTRRRHPPVHRHVDTAAAYGNEREVGAAILRCEFGGEITSNPADGAVEIVFADGGVLFCDTGPDGDSLRLEDFAWTDPFAGPLSPENEEFVRTSGK
jgi:hypothetical protein